MKFKKILKTIMASFMILGGACALTSCGVKKSNKNENTNDGPTYGIDNFNVKFNLGLKVGDLICPYSFYIKRSSAYTNPVDDYYLTPMVRQEIREKMGVEIVGTNLYHESNNNILFDNKEIVQEMNGYVDCEFLPNYFAYEVKRFFESGIRYIYEIKNNEENELYHYSTTDKTASGIMVDKLFKDTYNLEQNLNLENFNDVKAIMNSNGTLTGNISESENYTTTTTFNNKYFDNSLYSILNNETVFRSGNTTITFVNEFNLVEVKNKGLNGRFKLKSKEIDGKIYTYELLNDVHTNLKITIENVSDNSVEMYRIIHY